MASYWELYERSRINNLFSALIIHHIINFVFFLLFAVYWTYPHIHYTFVHGYPAFEGTTAPGPFISERFSAFWWFVCLTAAFRLLSIIFSAIGGIKFKRDVYLGLAFIFLIIAIILEFGMFFLNLYNWIFCNCSNSNPCNDERYCLVNFPSTLCPNTVGDPGLSSGDLGMSRIFRYFWTLNGIFIIVEIISAIWNNQYLKDITRLIPKYE